MAPLGVVTLLQRELRTLKEQPVEGFLIEANEQNILSWNVAIFGPPGTLYQGGYFKGVLAFPDQYPYRPPSLSFTTPIFHPNIYPDGRVCISILHPPGNDLMANERAEERWTPTQNVRTILISVISLLNEPNISSPANVDAAKAHREYKLNGNMEIIERLKPIIENSKKMAAADGVQIPETEADYVKTGAPKPKEKDVVSTSSEDFYNDSYGEEEEEDE